MNRRVNKQDGFYFDSIGCSVVILAQDNILKLRL